MPNKKRKTARNLSTVNVSGSLFNAVRKGDLQTVKKLIRAHGLSCHECGNKSYTLLFVAIMLDRVEIVNYLLEEGAKVDCETDRVDTLLHYAVGQKTIELVRLLLEKNAPIDAQNAQGETPLHLAVKEGCAEIVQLLLSKNASVTKQSKEDSTPLFLALEGGHEDIVHMLINHAVGNIKTSGKKEKSLLDRILLCNATAHDKTDKVIASIVTRKGAPSEIVDELVDLGFMPSRKNVDGFLLHAAIKKEHTTLVENVLTINNPNDATHNLQLLCDAVRNGLRLIVPLFLSQASDGKSKAKRGHTIEERKWIEVIEQLLGKGADFKEATDLLHLAIEKEFVEMCKFFTENEVNVNGRNRFGETPLFVSCGRRSGRKTDRIVQLLLQNGADVNIRIKTRSEYKANMCISAFHNAATNGRNEAVKTLLNFKVDVDLRAEDDSTALHFAAEHGSTEIVQILCENGANVEARRKDGSTPLHLAESLEVAKILLRFNADIDARGPKNETALHNVITSKDTALVLLNNGCDINAKNSEGNIAMDLIHLRAEMREGNIEWFLINRIRPVVMVLKKHATKLSAAGLYVNEKNFDLFESENDQLADFKLVCEEEVSRMTNEQLTPQFTLYNILVNGKNPSFAKNKPLMQTLKSFNLDSFPIYKRLIASNVKRSEFEQELIVKGQSSLNSLLKISNKLNGETYAIIPDEILEQIVTYLSIGELRNLISCGEALKRQVAR